MSYLGKKWTSSFWVKCDSEELDFKCEVMEYFIQFILLLLFSSPVVFDSLQLHGLQHARPPCPSPSPIVCPSSCSLHWWCHPAILSSDALFSFCPQSFPASGLFQQVVFCIRWPKYWSFSFSLCPSNEYSGLISLKIDWFDLLAVQGTFRSLLQHCSSKASKILWRSAFFMVQLPQSYVTTGKTTALIYGPLSAEYCLCFSTHCLGLSLLSCQEAIVLRFHDCSHHLQWFWSPGRGNP